MDLQDFLWLRDRFLSLVEGREFGLVAVLTQASRISSSPVSYMSESVVIPLPREPIDRASG